MKIEKEILDRLVYLQEKVNNQEATTAETDELMFLLYQNKQITENQYKKYVNSNNQYDKDEIIKVALVLVGILILGYLISKLLCK
jgi:DNA polymerase III delta subunit